MKKGCETAKSALVGVNCGMRDNRMKFDSILFYRIKI